MSQIPELFDPVDHIAPEELMRNSVVFKEANTIQRDLENGVEYARADQAYDAASALVRELDDYASGETLLGREAILKGSPLYTPSSISLGYTIPYLEVAEQYTQDSDGDEVGTPNNDYQEVRGLFSGFAAGVDIILDEDHDPRAYLPHIMYQVAIGQHITSPLLNGQLCAAGSVRDAEIEFEQDRRYIAAVTAAHDILSFGRNITGTEEIARHFIDICENRPIIKSLGGIGREIERIMKSSIERPELFAEVLLELPKSELENRVVEINVRRLVSVAQSDEEEGEGQHAIEDVYHPDGGHIVARISDIVLRPRAYYHSSTRSEPTGRIWIGVKSPHLCFEDEGRIFYAAFGDIASARYVD